MDILYIFSVIVFILIFVVVILLFRGFIVRLYGDARANKRMVSQARDQDTQRRRRNIKVHK